jgi:ribonuclease D
MDASRAGHGAASRSPRYYVVGTPDAFERALHTLNQAARVAIDIEADSLYHYFEKVCLVQISTDVETFIIDTLALKDLTALAPLMANNRVEKVFHAASYDVGSLRRDYGFSFGRIFDTHVAAQLLGYEHLGLSALLEELLRVVHSKHRQRDDWSRRPLEPEQLEYAAMDTFHLLELRDQLESQLSDKGRLQWAWEEFEAAAGCTSQEKKFDPEGFRRIKGSAQLSSRQLAILSSLYVLRDRVAREMDLPPFKVLNNTVLLDLSRRPPDSCGALLGRPGISHRVARRFADEIYAAIRQANLRDPSLTASEPRSSWKSPSAEAKLRLENLKAWRRARSKELGLHIGVLFPGNLLEILAAVPPSNRAAMEQIDGMRRWRVHEFGGEILDLLRAT